jgi:integrase
VIECWVSRDFAGVSSRACRVGGRLVVPGQGVRLQRAVPASSEGGELFVDTLKGKRARTVPLVGELVPVIDSWAQGKTVDDWLFEAPRGGPLSESNWKRSVGWTRATAAIGWPTLRGHGQRIGS